MVATCFVAEELQSLDAEALAVLVVGLCAVLAELGEVYQALLQLRVVDRQAAQERPDLWAFDLAAPLLHAMDRGAGGPQNLADLGLRPTRLLPAGADSSLPSFRRASSASLMEYDSASCGWAATNARAQ